MFTVKIKFIQPLVFLILVIVGLLAWGYADNLHRRFPDMDLSRFRLGIASWYSKTDKNINEHTANGEKFNDQEFTCASWEYPFGEKLLIINVLNGKWTVCRVNDRGPSKRLRREIDLTKTAFGKISSLRHGLTYVVVIPIQKNQL